LDGGRGRMAGFFLPLGPPSFSDRQSRLGAGRTRPKSPCDPGCCHGQWITRPATTGKWPDPPLNESQAESCFGRR